ncbi:MAG: hypothetical protein K2R98_01615 [Gemmataceae bacterium]|nr:hypothetical protein [Gemmataceae bacterium]
MRIVLIGILSGCVMLLIGSLFHVVWPILLPTLSDEYAAPSLFRPWEGGTRAYMLIHPLVVGVLLAGAFAWLVRKAGPDSPLRGVWGGARFGLGVCLIGSLPIFALDFASFRVSALVIATWAVQNAIQYVAAGAVLGRWLT